MRDARTWDDAALTGAIVVALGYAHVGLFANEDSFRDRMLAASKAEGEKMWAKPLDEEYKDGRWGGAISAAKFLQEFADLFRGFISIAETAWLEEGKPFIEKSPSGVAIRSFVNLAMNWK